MSQRIAIRGDLLDFRGDPGFDAVESPEVRFDRDHWLLIEAGRIVGRQPDAPDSSWSRLDHRGRLVMPGFIDTHVHSPQLDVIASYGAELLDWLNTYTFPAESRHAIAGAAVHGAQLFVQCLLAHGTTSAVVFPTVHKTSVDALFDAALSRNMRLISGKVLMDRNAPSELTDDVVGAERDCIELIERWHGRGRLAYAMTPRFAPTSSEAQLAMAGRLLAAVPDLYMQTHVAENRQEVQWVAELFPDARSYLDVYNRYGLLSPRAVLAHGIWLDGADRALLAECSAQIAHSPSSNLFLGSGLLDWRSLEESGAQVSIATDVGGGTSLSMLRTLAEAYKVQALQGRRLTAWKALYSATRGAARALRLEREIGSFDVGNMADIAIWNYAVGSLAAHRDAIANSLHERLFAFMTLGDERNLEAVFVAGALQSGAAGLQSHPR